MASDETRREEVLMKLFEMAWTNFDRRRAYEWKLSLGIWTALAAFIALVLRQGTTDFSGHEWVLAVPAGLILLIQGFFEYRVILANKVDQERAYLYEKELNELAGISFIGTRVQPAIDRVVKLWHGWWSLLVHVAITLVLMFAAASVVILAPTAQGSTAKTESKPSARGNRQERVDAARRDFPSLPSRVSAHSEVD